MGDPLSIAAGCLAVLSAAKAVGDLIADIVAAPEVLQQAKMDVGATATSVQSLSSYVNTTGETSLAGKEQLRAVLSSCETTCSQFSSSLRKFTKHSKAIDGKMSVLDRGALVLKKREVESFRRDIGCQRQAINVAAIPLSLSSSAQTTDAVQRLTAALDAARLDINDHLDSIGTRIEDLEDAGVSREEATMQALEARKSAMDDCLKLVEASQNATRKLESIKAVFGNLDAKDNAMVFQGVAPEKTQYERIELKFGDAAIGTSASALIGLADTAALQSFLTSRAGHTNSQGQSSGQQDASNALENQLQVRDLWSSVAQQ